jgi:acyl-coenzyme A thioesterase 9
VLYVLGILKERHLLISLTQILPLAQDKWLLDHYLNASGNIRLGSLLMDLDALAGVIAYRHTGDGVSTVTAAVDRITIEHPLMEICDLELTGQVSYATGRSSMEVSCQVSKVRPEGEPAKPEDVLITCAFTMVSLDPASKTYVLFTSYVPPAYTNMSAALFL